MLGWSHLTKKNNSVKTVGGPYSSCSLQLSDDALYLYQVLWKYLKGFQSYWGNTIFILIFTKGHNFVKHADVKLLVLFTLSDDALYFYQVMDRCTHTQKTGSLHFPMPEADATKTYGGFQKHVGMGVSDFCSYTEYKHAYKYNLTHFVCYMHLSGFPFCLTGKW